MSKELSLSEEGKEKQQKKFNRLLEKEKLKHLWNVHEGRRRSLKCEEFPELPTFLEYSFGEGGRIDNCGHPRLTDTILYKAADNKTLMQQAR